MLSLRTPSDARTIVRIAPSHEAVVAWNTRAPAGTLDLTIYRADGRVSTWLPYVSFSPLGRSSRCGADDVARIATDIVRADVPMVAIEVRGDCALDAIAVSTPTAPPSLSMVHDADESDLDVPALSQYDADRPGERGWCSPTSLAMILAYWGHATPLADVAHAVYDEAYGGTGNWTFNTAYASTRGLRAAVVHLGGLAHAAAFIEAGIPLALSFAWSNDELPGAPLDHSGGHLAVLRGFTREGHPRLNDPAQADLTTVYDRAALERVWRAHGGVAFAMVPAERSADLVRLANG